MVVCINVVFGGRMRENALRMGAKVVTVEDDFGQPVDPAKVEAALAANPQTKVLAFVHAETSTGVRSDAQSLCALARAHAALSIVDAVTSLGGIALAVDDWGIQQTRRQCGGPCYWTMGSRSVPVWGRLPAKFGESD